MALYQYPAVRGPSSQHLPLSSLAAATQDDRYSFAPGRVAEQQYFSALPTLQSNIRPRPQVPQYEAPSYTSPQHHVDDGSLEQHATGYSNPSPVSSTDSTDVKEPISTSPKPRKPRPLAIVTSPTTHRASLLKPPLPLEPDQNPLTEGPATTQPWQDPKSPIAASLPPLSAAYSSKPYGPLTSSGVEGGSWQHSLCSCVEPSICLPSMFCPCVIYGKTQYRLSLRSEKKDPTNMLGYSTVNGSCVAFGLLCGINGLLAAIQHTRIRKAYGMEKEAGSVVADCVKGDEKEVRFREEEARKGPSVRKEGYFSPGAMIFPTPMR